MKFLKKRLISELSEIDSSGLSLNPDYRFEIKIRISQFWVECKFRGNSQNSNLISVFKPEQLSRYQTLSKFISISLRLQV